MKVINVRT